MRYSLTVLTVLMASGIAACNSDNDRAPHFTNEHQVIAGSSSSGSGGEMNLSSGGSTSETIGGTTSDSKAGKAGSGTGGTETGGTSSGTVAKAGVAGVAGAAGATSGTGGTSSPKSSWVSPADWSSTQKPTGCEVNGVVCSPFDWDEVRNYCAGVGGRLPTLTEAVEIPNRPLTVYVEGDWDNTCVRPGETGVHNCLMLIYTGQLQRSDVGVYCVFD